MRNLLTFVLLSCGITGFGCWSSPPAKNTVSTVSEPGITQPSPPDPSKIAGTNPRDPKNRKERPDMNPSATPQPSTPKPAPENSQASVMMNTDGSITEFRVFRGHPQIVKAEATWQDPNDKTLKVFLKNGKILEAKTDRIPYLHTVPSALLLEVVGEKPVATNADRPRIISNK